MYYVRSLRGCWFVLVVVLELEQPIDDEHEHDDENDLVAALPPCVEGYLI